MPNSSRLAGSGTVTPILPEKLPATDAVNPHSVVPQMARPGTTFVNAMLSERSKPRLVMTADVKLTMSLGRSGANGQLVATRRASRQIVEVARTDSWCPAVARLLIVKVPMKLWLMLPALAAAAAASLVKREVQERLSSLDTPFSSAVRVTATSVPVIVVTVWARSPSP